MRTILDAVDDVPGFRDLRLDEREPFIRWMTKNRVRASDLTFANLYVWRRSRPVRIARSGDFLLILRFDEFGEPRAQAPIGGGDPTRAAEELLDYLGSAYPETDQALVRVPDPPAGVMREAGYIVDEDRNNFDYVYRVADLARLEGRRFEKKRNRVNKCMAENACSYEPVTAATLDACYHLDEEWCDIRRCILNPPLTNEFRAIREALDAFDELDLFGGAALIDGRVQAFALGERVGGNTVVEHFEKANPAVNGLNQLMVKWFCMNALDGVTWINREQDLGIEGLRRAKMSYHPDHFVKKYTVRRMPRAGGNGK